MEIIFSMEVPWFPTPTRKKSKQKITRDGIIDFGQRRKELYYLLDTEDNGHGEPLIYSVLLGKSGGEITMLGNSPLQFTAQAANLQGKFSLWIDTWWTVP